MITKVGLQANFISALQDLAELDFDAIEAYEAAINRLENSHYKNKLTEFKNDHVEHTRVINDFLSRHKEEKITEPSAKSLLTKGKVVIADLFGEKAILSAMLSNEMDTNTAYENLSSHEHLDPDAAGFLHKGLQDEKKHKTWIESEVSKLNAEKYAEEEA